MNFPAHGLGWSAGLVSNGLGGGPNIQYDWVYFLASLKIDRTIRLEVEL